MIATSPCTVTSSGMRTRAISISIFAVLTLATAQREREITNDPDTCDIGPSSLKSLGEASLLQAWSLNSKIISDTQFEQTVEAAVESNVAIARETNHMWRSLLELMWNNISTSSAGQTLVSPRSWIESTVEDAMTKQPERVQFALPMRPENLNFESSFFMLLLSMMSFVAIIIAASCICFCWEIETTPTSSWRGSQPPALQSPHGTVARSQPDLEREISSGVGTEGILSTPGGTDRKVRMRLFDTHKVGEVLGQGAFGIVYACTPLEQDRDYAVKMIDKVETPADKIDQEVNMLRIMNHKNVIKCHDVIHEKCFVCIVMDRLRGGDLILGMQTHWKSKGKIPVGSTVFIIAQMAASVNYLHQRSIIHRDVKGDNYLCDRADITDPQCRTVLADFGTAMACKATERLNEHCGTKEYWPIEFYEKDYSLKVDIWALGVCVYGLLYGKFPFRTETDIHNKHVHIAKGTPQKCKDFLMSLLTKNEERRADSKQVVEDGWLVNTTKRGDDTEFRRNSGLIIKGDEDEAEFKPDDEDFRQDGPNPGVQERRVVLVERMQDGADKAVSLLNREPNEKHYWKDWFSIVDRRAHSSTLKSNSTVKYEWWPLQKADEAGISSLEGSISAIDKATVAAELSDEVICRHLRDQGVDIEQWGRGNAKSLQALVEEVHKGSSVLMLDAAHHKKLVRVVDVVIVRICAPGDHDRFIVELSEKFSDGRERQLERLPAIKKEPYENAKQAADRIVAQVLDLGGATVGWDLKKKEICEEQQESPSFPGLLTVYRKQMIEGILQGDPENYVGRDAKGAFEWFREKQSKNTSYFGWKTVQECQQHGILYKLPEQSDDISGLVQAPIGLEVGDLREYLQKHQVDISKFGQGSAKSLEDISAEMMKGKSRLMVEQDGTVTRIVDVVIIKLFRKDTQTILVQREQTFPDGEKTVLNRLPGAKRRPDENQFITVRRVLVNRLKIDDSLVDVDAGDVQIAEQRQDSLAYPGLRTVYRKQIITATLAKDE